MPVDKHDCTVIKNIYPNPLTSEVGLKVNYLNFAMTNILTEISHGDRGTINVKHVKRDFRYKGLCPTPWVGDGAEAKIHFFQSMVMLHSKVQGQTHAVAWWQIFHL